MGFGVKYLGAVVALLILAGAVIGGVMIADGAGDAVGDARVGARLPLPGPTNVARAETIALKGATSARVEVALEVGELRLAGGTMAEAGAPLGSGQLLRGEFTTTGGEPAIDYVVDRRVGILHLAQAEGEGPAWPWRDRAERWNLYLNPTVPTDLHVQVGAGESRLALGGLSLSGLDVAVGVGPTTIDFAGDWRQGLSGRIQGGAGDLTLRLPRGVGVRVALEQGMGDVEVDGFRFHDGAYANAAYGTSPITIDLTVEHGAGDVTLELGG